MSDIVVAGASCKRIDFSGQYKGRSSSYIVGYDIHCIHPTRLNVVRIGTNYVHPIKDSQNILPMELEPFYENVTFLHDSPHKFEEGDDYMKCKLSQYLLVVIVLFLSFGCASLTEVDKPPRETSLMSAEENALVFGRVRWIENGEIKYNTAVKLRILRVEDMKKDDVQVNMDGHFLLICQREHT